MSPRERHERHEERRQQRRAKAKAKGRGKTRSTFGRELAMLAAGEPILNVVLSFTGRTALGWEWYERWRALFGELEKGVSRRKVLEIWLRMWEHAKWVKPRAAGPHEVQRGHWRVLDKGGWVGRQHELCASQRLDSDTGEVISGPLKLRHVPAAEAAGLAARLHRSPRQCNRYRALLRAGRIQDSQRTHRRMPDAVMPESKPDSDWGYAQVWLKHRPSEEMLRRFAGYVPPRYPERVEGGPRPAHARGRLKLPRPASGQGPPEAS